MHILKGRRHILWENLVLSCFTLCLFSRCFMVFWVIFSIYALLLSAHRVYVLDVHISLLVCFINCMFGWSFALLYDYYGHFHMTVLCLIKLLICFISYLLDCILLVIFYLSFYHLIYHEGLMRFVQVFQVIGIYVTSSSQLLDLGVSEFCHCSQTHF